MQYESHIYAAVESDETASGSADDFGDDEACCLKQEELHRNFVDPLVVIAARGREISANRDQYRVLKPLRLPGRYG